MAFSYKRRRPSIVRNFWVYRRLIALAMLLGLILWFVSVNNAPVTVAFPFGLGTIASTAGLVILASALVGSLTTLLIMTVVVALRRQKGRNSSSKDDQDDDDDPDERPDERPPTDYAAKTTEGFPDLP